MGDQDIELIVHAYTPTAPVPMPPGSNGLALALLDSIHSTGIRYSTVERLLDRYRAFRRTAGADPESDGVRELLDAIDDDPERFATDILRNRNLTASRNGVLKSIVVLRAAELLLAHGVEDMSDFVRVQSEPIAARLEAAWLALPGQRSGITWRYLRMLCGIQDVKPDRMIHRFIRDAIGRQVSDIEAVELVTAVARRIGSSPIEVDHRIWQHQRRRRARRPADRVAPIG